eukprot:TRINITY_DN12741_c0_g1_i4.p1 TRINITY_DN12741_c0_g1~~TRINITY_DN12741_c0_g1_i4.p1  ORF type:complete len:243 (+),score=45.83 TRINITY_DN12741_c0_g1_i4:784-1512(+)
MKPRMLAPNYLDTYGNRGAVLCYENNVINIRQFNESPHPYFLPGFMNVFNWSLPFLLEKISDFLRVVRALVDDEEADRAEEEARRMLEEKERKREILRNKVKTVSRMLAIFNAMRRERQAVATLSLSPKNDEIPPSLKRRGPLRNSLGSFNRVRAIDLSNEKRPEGVERVHERVMIQMSNPSSPTAIRKRKSREILSSSRSTSPPSQWSSGSVTESPKLVESGFSCWLRNSLDTSEKGDIKK